MSKIVNLTIPVEEELKNKIKAYAKGRGLTTASFVRMVLIQILKEGEIHV